MKFISICFSVLCLGLILIDCTSYRQWGKSQQNALGTRYITEEMARNYLQSNISTLDQIEGIWLVSSRTELGYLSNESVNHSKVIILKDTSGVEQDFIEIVLSSNSGWKPNQITAYFNKTIYPNIYTSTQFDSKGNTAEYNFTFEGSGYLRASKKEVYKGFQGYQEISYIKAFPTIDMFRDGGVTTHEFIEAEGTGFLLSNSGYIVTANHLINGADNIRIYFPGHKEHFGATIWIRDTQNDIAILSMDSAVVSNLNLGEVPFSFGDIASYNVGVDVFTLGYPLGELMGASPRLSSGVISSKFGIRDDPRMFQISTPIQPGNSGGPLFTQRGELIGIVISALNAKYFFEQMDVVPQNVNFAIKADYLKNLIRMLPNPPEKLYMPINNGESIEDIISKISPFIVNIKCDKEIQ